MIWTSPLKILQSTIISLSIKCNWLLWVIVYNEQKSTGGAQICFTMSKGTQDRTFN